MAKHASLLHERKDLRASLSLFPNPLSLLAKKQIAGNYSSPATEDTGMDQKNVVPNKRVQGVINKIVSNQGTYK
jgi:hypothetical protein